MVRVFMVQFGRARLLIQQWFGQWPPDFQIAQINFILNHAIPLQQPQHGFHSSIVAVPIAQSFPQPVDPKSSDLLGAVREQMVRALAKFRVRICPANKLHSRIQIPLVVQEHTFGWQPVSTGTANFLII